MEKRYKCPLISPSREIQSIKTLITLGKCILKNLCVKKNYIYCKKLVDNRWKMCYDTPEFADVDSFL